MAGIGDILLGLLGGAGGALSNIGQNRLQSRDDLTNALVKLKVQSMLEAEDPYRKAQIENMAAERDLKSRYYDILAQQAQPKPSEFERLLPIIGQAGTEQARQILAEAEAQKAEYDKQLGTPGYRMGGMGPDGSGAWGSLTSAQELLGRARSGAESAYSSNPIASLFHRLGGKISGVERPVMQAASEEQKAKKMVADLLNKRASVDTLPQVRAIQQAGGPEGMGRQAQWQAIMSKAMGPQLRSEATLSGVLAGQRQRELASQRKIVMEQLKLATEDEEIKALRQKLMELMGGGLNPAEDVTAVYEEGVDI